MSGVPHGAMQCNALLPQTDLHLKSNAGACDRGDQHMDGGHALMTTG